MDKIDYRNVINNKRFHSIGKKYLVELQLQKKSRKNIHDKLTVQQFKYLA